MTRVRRAATQGRARSVAEVRLELQRVGEQMVAAVADCRYEEARLWCPA